MTDSSSLPRLDAHAARALAVLLEKEKTVPDSYPMSLNTLLAGCNQRSNRDPVMNLNETELLNALETLRGLSLVIESSGGRVTRYEHNLPRVLGIPSEAAALLSVLMLRGPQTAAGLRAHVERQAKFADTSSVEAYLQEMAERITIVSAERVQAELTGLLLTDSPREGLDLLVRTGLAEHFLPELPALRLERDEHMRHKDVYAHSLTVLEQAIDLEKARGHQPDIVNRLAALLHDIGKPATRRFEGSKVTFHHHDVVGAKLVTKRLKALKYPTATVKSVAKLVELHLRFHGYGEASWSDSAVRRYVRDAGDELERLHILTRADCTTRNRNKATRLRRNYEELEWRIDELAAQEEIKAIRPDLDGAQIMEILGIKPGPDVGKAYKFLLNHRMDHGPLPEDEARDLLLTWWKDQQSQG